MYSRTRQLLSLFLLVLLLVLTAVVSRRCSMRLDLTEDRLYSIHPFSHQVIQSLTEPVHLSYYVSPRLDGLSPIPQEIRDFLGDYAASSNGRVQVEYVDASQPEHAAAARERGILPQQIEAAPGRGSPAAAETAVYSGLVVSYADEGFTLPFILDPTAVEYRLTTALQRLITGTQPIIGVLFGTDGLSLADTHREMKQQLEQVYRVIELSKGFPIPAEVDAVFLIGGRDLTAESIRHLDRFLVSGGGVLAAVDAVEIDLESNLYPEALGSDHPVLTWLEHHGALLRPELVLDQYNRSIPNQGAESTNQYQAYQEYPHWVQIQGRGADPDHPLTVRFTALDLYWPGTLTLIPGSGRETTPLLHTSPDSWVLRERYFTAPEDALQSRNASLDTDGNYIVAGEISGRFTPQPVGDAAPASAAEPAGDSRLVVIADADFSSDLIRYTGSGYNMLFLAGAADWLANDPAVLDMRTRGYANNRLNELADPAMYRVYAAAAQAIILLVVPLLPFTAGLFVFTRRRRITPRGEDPANAR